MRSSSKSIVTISRRLFNKGSVSFSHIHSMQQNNIHNCYFKQYSSEPEDLYFNPHSPKNKQLNVEFKSNIEHVCEMIKQQSENFQTAASQNNPNIDNNIKLSMAEHLEHKKFIKDITAAQKK